MSDEPSGRELAPREPDDTRAEDSALTPAPEGEQRAVERFSAGPKAHMVGLTEERGAQIVRQSANARSFVFLAVLAIALFIPVYWFAESGIPALGTEGRLVELQLEDMLVGVREDRADILADYLPDSHPITGECAEAPPISQVRSVDLLSLTYVAESLGFGKDMPLDKHVRPRGFRLLRRIPRLYDWVADAVVSHFGDLNHLIESPLDELAAVPGVGFPRAREIKDGLNRIYETTLLERRG
jgi:hypothetical protein